MNEHVDEELVEEALEDMREEYREETGEELPDHVLENYDDFLALGPSLDDIERAFHRGREAAPEEYTEEEYWTAVRLTVGAAGIFAFILGLAIGVSFAAIENAMALLVMGLVVGFFLSWLVEVIRR